MRLSILPFLLASATAVSLVAAEPIRVIDSPSNANANIRFGHALANANVNGNDDNVARIVRPIVSVERPPHGMAKGLINHICGASLREFSRLSDTVRHVFGMQIVETHRAPPRPGLVHIIPLDGPTNLVLHPQGDLDEEGKPRGPHVHEHSPDDHDHPRHRGRHGHHHRRKTFVRRIHRAIKALGPWEGRAVAFVLGCGIGVLLRMFWVLCVLTYRTIRGERGEDALDREYFVYEHVPETLFAAPQYFDEKVREETSEETEHK